MHHGTERTKAIADATNAESARAAAAFAGGDEGMQEEKERWDEVLLRLGVSQAGVTAISECATGQEVIAAAKKETDDTWRKIARFCGMDDGRDVMIGADTITATRKAVADALP